MTLDHLTDLQLALGLMAGDPANFKQGYTLDNAVLAVEELRDLTPAEVQRLREEVSRVR